MLSIKGFSSNYRLEIRKKFQKQFESWEMLDKIINPVQVIGRERGLEKSRRYYIVVYSGPFKQKLL